MNKQEIAILKQQFDQHLHRVKNTTIEFCYARDLMNLLGYDRWENFVNVINKAKEACQNSNALIEDHFRNVIKMVEIGSQAERQIVDIQLTRYACYLVAQNGDPRKKEIAFAQTYFALQTRKQELLEERIALDSRLKARKKLREAETELSENLYQRGVDDQGFGRIRSKGDTALFGGIATEKMKKRLNVPKNRPLADFLPTVTIAAKNLAAEMTNYNIKQNNLYGETHITEEHVQNNKSVRHILGSRGIKPEELPAEEDLTKLERRVAKNEKLLVKNTALPKASITKTKQTASSKEARESFILQQLSENKNIKTETLAEQCNVSRRTILRDLERLKQANKLTFIGNPKTGYWQLHEEEKKG